MSRRRLRNLLVLALLAGAGYWIYRDRPTVTGLVDRVTRPIFQSKAAVQESEHKRVESEAIPVIAGNQDVSVGALRQNMTRSEVRDLLGYPDKIEPFSENGRARERWTYQRVARAVVFEDGRVVSIAIL